MPPAAPPHRRKLERELVAELERINGEHMVELAQDCALDVLGVLARNRDGDGTAAVVDVFHRRGDGGAAAVVGRMRGGHGPSSCDPGARAWQASRAPLC